jgi:hypothetical protein
MLLTLPLATYSNYLHRSIGYQLLFNFRSHNGTQLHMRIKFIQEWHLRSRTNSPKPLSGGGGGGDDTDMIF